MTRCRIRRCRAFASIGLFLIALGAPRSATAQADFPPTTPRYVAVVRLAQEGYADSARKSIQRILQGMPSSDPTYAEALYTSAIVRSGEDSRQQFAQVALEYPTSGWADKAFYRLALMDFGLNAIDASINSFKRIFSEYPRSPVIPFAALYGSRAAFQKNDLPLGCDWIRKGLMLVGTDAELKNQLDYAKGRCVVGIGVEVGPPPLVESLRVAPPTGRPVPPAPAVIPPLDTTTRPKPAAVNPADKWRVQVAAITSKNAIASTVAKLRKAGYTVYQIDAGKTRAGANLVKIQAGPFATRDAAVAKVAALKKVVGGTPFVVPTP